MPVYQIEVTEEAAGDLVYYTAFERQRIVSQMRVQLSFEPLVSTKNRKPLRDNPLAPRELRIGKFRVFYKVDEDIQMVVIVSVGHKEHNILMVRGREVKL